MINGVFLLLMAAPAAPITDVVVYAEGARVTRTATVDCAGRTTDVAFPGLPAAADVDSLQAVATGARVVAVRRDRPAPPDDPAAARALARVRAEKAKLVRRAALDDAAGTRADGYGELVQTWAQRGLWRGSGTPARWAAAAETILSETLAIARARAADKARLRQLDDEEAALARKIDALERLRRDPPATARVLVACQGRARVALLYFVRGAAWQPVHEVRAGEDGVEIVTSATVRQTTGEPWSGVRLVLSTARPGDDASPPELDPIVIWSEAEEAPKRIVGASEEIARPPSAPTSPAAASGFAAHALATELHVPAPARIPADGTDVRVLVARTHQTTPLRLRATPRLATAVFRVAELVNRAPFPLLPGRLEIFRRGTFLGAQPLREEVPSGGRFLVSFGVDEDVRVGRVILREIERPAGLLGRARQHQFAYRFELASHLAAPAELELVDHLPVSQLDDVKVAIEPSTTAGYRLAPDDGIVTWRVRLRPGEAQTVALAFHVDVPAAYQ